MRRKRPLNGGTVEVEKEGVLAVDFNGQFNDVEDLVWRNPEFFANSVDVFKFGTYSVRFEHNKAREMNYMYILKSNPKREVGEEKDANNYLDFSAIEFKDLNQYLINFFEEVDDTNIGELIPSLKKSKAGKLFDPQEEAFWLDKNLTKTLESGRILIRPLVNGEFFIIK